MKRNVFLIKGYFSDENHSLSADHYLKEYQKFFTSNAGGAYDADEVIVLNEPRTIELRKKLENKELDYSIVVLIGHGATQSNEQLFLLNDSDIIKAGQITTNAKKQIIIVESCRTVSEEFLTTDLNDKIPKFRDGGTVRFPVSRKDARTLYDNQIQKSSEGLVICFACDLDQEAVNFCFTFGVIQISFNWHLDHNNTQLVLPITTLMNYLVTEIPKYAIEHGINQSPKILGNTKFPFVVSKY